MSIATTSRNLPNLNRIQSMAVRVLWDEATTRNGLSRGEALRVMRMYEPSEVDHAIRWGLHLRHLIECRRHAAGGPVETVFHSMGPRP